MIRNNISPKQVVNFLNKTLKHDYTAISSLFQIRVYCNIKTATHKSIQVFKTGKDSYIVGFLGLLNGIFGVGKNGFGYIGMKCKGTKIQKFILIKKNQ